MSDIALSVVLSRDALGLPPLQINDHLNYYIAPSFLGASQSWQRNTVGSPFIDGTTTTFRTRQMVQEPIQVEVPADTTAELYTQMATIVQAFSQDSFTMTVTVNGQVTQYACEAADFTVLWQSPRIVNKQGQVTFTMPRQPVPLTGSF